MASRPSASPGPSVPAGGRSLALDVLRGLTIGVLIFLVFTPTTGWRGHAAWWGWRPSDFFFPFFLFIAGAGVAHQSLRRGVPWARLFRRVALLVVLGLAVNWWSTQGADVPLRWTGVLQRIALVSLVGTGFMAALRFRWQASFAAAVVCAAAWAATLSWASIGCAGGIPTADGCGTFLAVDEGLFGASRIYAGGAAGHDPEGVASSLGALATFLSGFAAGAVAHRYRGRRRVLTTLAMGLGWLAVLPVFLQFQPVGKRMWTPAYVAAHSAAALLILAALMLALDTERTPSWTKPAAWPLQALGRNVLGLWLGLFLIDPVLKRTDPTTGTALWERLVDSVGPLTYGALFIGLFVAVAAELHRRRLYFRL